MKRTAAALGLAAGSMLLGQAPGWAAAGPARAEHYFASRPGLMRIYQKGDAASAAASAPPPGASCEVVEAQSKASGAPRVRERCALLIERHTRPATLLTYELRRDGIFVVRTQPEGGTARDAERLVLPSPLESGSSWAEGPPAGNQRVRTIARVGGSCRAAGRTFADCLVIDVSDRAAGKETRRTREVYAAGVGLVEDEQWQLIDVKGL